MSQQRINARRGYTIAEVLTVTVIMGFISTFVALIVGPTFRAVNQQGAKIDTLTAAERAFYRIQRDIHQSNVNGVYVCTYPAPSTCAPPTAALANATVIVMITPKKNGTGQLAWDTAQGQPQWQGFNIYWLAPDKNGVSSLNYAFNDPTGGATETVGSADAAVDNALAAQPQFLATSVTGIQISQNVTTSKIGLKMLATATEGTSTNTTSFESDTTARN
ncbi:MAG TPA: type II secretion system protein [Candidatus Binatus sp.]|nr:type II secretion system protein [Candidatus Binatus sp.]